MSWLIGLVPLLCGFLQNMKPKDLLNWRKRVILGIVGSRTFKDAKFFYESMKQFEHITSIVSGGAKGADTMAAKYAKVKGIHLIEFYPDYDTHGKSAPFIRNSHIVDNSDVIVAFWDGVSRGTLDTINKARKQNKQVSIFRF